MLGWFDKFLSVFKKEHNLAAIEEIVENLEEQREITGNEPICEVCEQPIFPDQRIKRFQGKTFHMKPCWFKLQKEAQKQRWQ